METKTKTPSVVPHLDLEHDWDLTCKLLCDADLQHQVKDENPRSLFTVEEMIDNQMNYLRYSIMSKTQ